MGKNDFSWIAFDREHERAEEAANAAGDEVAKQVAAMIADGGDCYPLDPRNFDEALSDALGQFPSTNLARVLTLNIKNGTPCNLALEAMAYAYWNSRAEQLVTGRAA